MRMKRPSSWQIPLHISEEGCSELSVEITKGEGILQRDEVQVKEMGQSERRGQRTTVMICFPVPMLSCPISCMSG